MHTSKREGIRKLLKGIETGDPKSVLVVNEDRYVQHNPTTREGSEGLAELFKRLSKTSPTVEIFRVFEDGEYVFAHVEYDFAEVVAGFEVFRFEDGFAVEHWDNLQPKHEKPNESGHTMLDGPVEITDLQHTESNRSLVESFAVEILVGREVARLGDYVEGSRQYVEHNPHRADGIEVLEEFLLAGTEAAEPVLDYTTVHRVLAEGNFVLCASEGRRDGADVAIYDLYRVEANRIVEHWDSIESIPPRAEWLNENGKF